MSNREFVTFREVLKQYPDIDEDIKVDLTPSFGKVNIGDRSFTYKFYVKNGDPILELEFAGCSPNPSYLVRNEGDCWTMQDGDPIDDLYSDELADYCVSLLYSDDKNL